MPDLEHFVRTVSIRANNDDELASMIRKESVDGFELSKIVTYNYEGNTESSATLVYQRNYDYISVYFYENDTLITDRFMTAEQVKLIKNIGKIEINDLDYNIKDINLVIIEELGDFNAVIDINEIKQ